MNLPRGDSTKESPLIVPFAHRSGRATAPETIDRRPLCGRGRATAPEAIDRRPLWGPGRATAPEAIDRRPLWGPGRATAPEAIDRRPSGVRGERLHRRLSIDDPWGSGIDRTGAYHRPA